MSDNPWDRPKTEAEKAWRAQPTGPIHYDASLALAWMAGFDVGRSAVPTTPEDAS